jgi:aspartate ammonia-lyase
MVNSRIETNLLGTKQIPSHALWDIHTAHAIENFPLIEKPIHSELIKAYGEVKLVCCQINKQLGYFKEIQNAQVIEKACF